MYPNFVSRIKLQLKSEYYIIT